MKPFERFKVLRGPIDQGIMAENYTKLHCTLIIFLHILLIKEIFFTAIA